MTSSGRVSGRVLSSGCSSMKLPEGQKGQIVLCMIASRNIKLSLENPEWSMLQRSKQ